MTPLVLEYGRHRYPRRSFWLGVAVLKQKPALGALIESDVLHIVGCWCGGVGELAAWVAWVQTEYAVQ